LQDFGELRRNDVVEFLGRASRIKDVPVAQVEPAEF
jgi:hypothetical protein